MTITLHLYRHICIYDMCANTYVKNFFTFISEVEANSMYPTSCHTDKCLSIKTDDQNDLPGSDVIITLHQQKFCAIRNPQSRATSMFTHNYWLIYCRSESHTPNIRWTEFYKFLLPHASNFIVAFFPRLCVQDVISN